MVKCEIEQKKDIACKHLFVGYTVLMLVYTTKLLNVWVKDILKQTCHSGFLYLHESDSSYNYI